MKVLKICKKLLASIQLYFVQKCFEFKYFCQGSLNQLSIYHGIKDLDWVPKKEPTQANTSGNESLGIKKTAMM